jgi:general secretion pathway protein A
MTNTTPELEASALAPVGAQTQESGFGRFFRSISGQANKPNKLNGFSGLTANPFRGTWDSGCPPLTPSERRALSELMQGIQSRRGLLLLTGEVGTGKTVVISQLRTWLSQQSMSSAFVFNPLLDTHNFFDFVLGEFGIQLDNRAPGNSFTCLSKWLFARHREAATVVLIVDEAQGLSVSVLQALGMLVSLEAAGQKLLQIVLAGEPELNDKLRTPELLQLRQLVVLRCRTTPLSIEETHSYLQELLRTTGSESEPVFSVEARDAAHFYSGGIPRVINVLCEHAMANARSRQTRPVPAYIVEEVARELQFDQARPIAPSLSSLYSANGDSPVMVPQSITPEPASAAAVSETPAADESITSPATLGNEPLISNHEREVRSVLFDAPEKLSALPHAPQVHATPRQLISPVALLARRCRAWVAAFPRPSFRFAAPRRISRLIISALRSVQTSAAYQIRRDLRNAAVLLHLRSSNFPFHRRYRFSFGSLPDNCRQAWVSLVRWLKEPMHTMRPRRSLSGR